MTSEQTPPRTDEHLLRRFEPVLRFTKGEHFFPMDVERYIKQCSLWVQQPETPRRRIWPEGEVTLDKLAEARDYGDDAVFYLKFIEPVGLGKALTTQLGNEERFKGGNGRLARVGYLSRFIDALFSLSLLARGRIKGDTAISAIRTYSQLQAEREQYHYYGRVLRRDGWIVLQYWFFYAFNNWRSGFYGANDHEADWEMICVYLYEEDGDVKPEWVAYASHDFSGDDLRRRWDDPELTKEGEHPVVYAGAGSHASYFQAGEYLTQLVLPFMIPFTKIIERVQIFIETTFLDYEQMDKRWRDFGIFRVPFVDYAQGNGRQIGPEQWSTPTVISNPPAWVRHYRGLWGLFARDPFSGEDAPAGPMYNRDGTVRQAWYDPIGWSGLDKVVPPNKAISQIDERLEGIEERADATELEILQKSQLIRELGVEYEALAGQPHLQPQRKEIKNKSTMLSKKVDSLRAQLTTDYALKEALKEQMNDIKRGKTTADPRAHIKHSHDPEPDAQKNMNRFTELWAAISIGSLMLAFVLLIFMAPEHLLTGAAILLVCFIGIESLFRGRIAQILSISTILLSLIAVGILLTRFFSELLAVVILLAGSYITWENVRELR